MNREKPEYKKEEMQEVEETETAEDGRERNRIKHLRNGNRRGRNCGYRNKENNEKPRRQKKY